MNSIQTLISSQGPQEQVYDGEYGTQMSGTDKVTFALHMREAQRDLGSEVDGLSIRVNTLETLDLGLTARVEVLESEFGAGGLRLSDVPPTVRRFTSTDEAYQNAGSNGTNPLLHRFVAIRAVTFTNLRLPQYRSAQSGLYTNNNASPYVYEVLNRYMQVVAFGTAAAVENDPSIWIADLNTSVTFGAGEPFYLRVYGANGKTPLCNTHVQRGAFTTDGDIQFIDTDAVGYGPLIEFASGHLQRKQVIGPLDLQDLPGFKDAPVGSRPIKVSEEGLGWTVVTESGTGTGTGTASPLTETSNTTGGSANFDVLAPSPAGFLRRIVTTAPGTVAVYLSSADRLADSNRLDNTPAADPAVDLLAQVTTVAGGLTVAVGEAFNQATLYVRVTNANTVKLGIETTEGAGVDLAPLEGRVTALENAPDADLGTLPADFAALSLNLNLPYLDVQLDHADSTTPYNNVVKRNTVLPAELQGPQFVRVMDQNGAVYAPQPHGDEYDMLPGQWVVNEGQIAVTDYVGSPVAYPLTISYAPTLTGSLGHKLDKPAANGTTGQVLVLGADGKATWEDALAGGGEGGGTVDLTPVNAQLASLDTRVDALEAAPAPAGGGATSAEPTGQNPVGFYAPESAAVFPRGGYQVVGDPCVVDDRQGVTGKVWAFLYAYSAGVFSLLRTSADRPDAPANQWSVYEVVATGLTKLRLYPKPVGGKWYGVVTTVASNTPTAYNSIRLVSFDRLDGAMANLRAITAAGANGNDSMTDNGTLWQEADGTWTAFWSSTPDAAPYASRLRRATSPDLTTWTVQAGNYLTVAQVGAGVAWVRSISLTRLPDGRTVACLGAGTITDSQGADKNARVYLAYRKADGSLDTPTLVLDPGMYPASGSGQPTTSPVQDNIYAPFLFLDRVNGEVSLWANTGPYGTEQTFRFNLRAAQSWNVGTTSVYGPSGWLTLTTDAQDFPGAGFFLPEGHYAVDVEGQAFYLPNANTATVHDQIMQLVDASGAVVIEKQIGLGHSKYEQVWYGGLFVALTVPPGGQRYRVRGLYAYSGGAIPDGEFPGKSSLLRGIRLRVNPITTALNTTVTSVTSGTSAAGLPVSAVRLAADGQQIYQNGAARPELEYRFGGKTWVLTMSLLLPQLAQTAVAPDFQQTYSTFNAGSLGGQGGWTADGATVSAEGVVSITSHFAADSGTNHNYLNRPFYEGEVAMLMTPAHPYALLGVRVQPNGERYGLYGFWDNGLQSVQVAFAYITASAGVTDFTAQAGVKIAAPLTGGCWLALRVTAVGLELRTWAANDVRPVLAQFSKTFASGGLPVLPEGGLSLGYTRQDGGNASGEIRALRITDGYNAPNAQQAQATLVGRWFPRINDGTAQMQTINQGSAIYANFTGETLSARFDVPASATKVPTLSVSIDGGPAQLMTLTAAGVNTLPLANGLLPSVPHTVKIVVDGIHEADPVWTTGLGLGFIGLQGDENAQFSPLAPAGVPLLSLSDSIGAGVLARVGGGTAPAASAASLSYPRLTAEALGREVIMAGFGGTGLSGVGSGAVPDAASFFQNFHQGRPIRSFPAVSGIVTEFGTNDVNKGTSAADFQTQYTALIATLRTKYPAAPIYLMRPPNGAYAAQIQAVANANANCSYFDTSGLNLTFTDGTHPDLASHQTIATALKAFILAHP